jgi:hypothetical protein
MRKLLSLTTILMLSCEGALVNSMVLPAETPTGGGVSMATGGGTTGAAGGGTVSASGGAEMGMGGGTVVEPEVIGPVLPGRSALRRLTVPQFVNTVNQLVPVSLITTAPNYVALLPDDQQADHAYFSNQFETQAPTLSDVMDYA